MALQKPHRLYRRNLFIAIAVLVISGTVLLTVFFSSSRVLQIRDSNSGRLYGSWPLDQSAEFSIEFIHSVNQSPIRESFKAERPSIQGIAGVPGLKDIVPRWKIRPVAVHFYTFGAGVQSDLEEGQTLTRDGDAMIISGFNTSFRELNIIVGTVSDHLLYINGETVSLRDLCGRNAHITIRIR